MIARSQFNQIQQLLFKNKVVIIYGARQIGKTQLSKDLLEYYNQQGLKTKYFDCELFETVQALDTSSLAKLKALIGIYDLVVLDEAQKIPSIGQVLKILQDNLPNTQVIATGSSSFQLANYTGEPLVGRSRNILMFPISSLELVKQFDINYLRENIYSLIQYGMLPAVLTSQDTDEKLAELEQITNSYLYKDLLKLSEIRKPEILEKLVKILAHSVGSQVSHSSIANTLQVATGTVDNYIDILQKAFILYKLPPFSTNLKSEIKNKPKYYFYDTGVLNILLERFSPNLNDRYTGGVFENFVIMEKLKQNEIQKTRNKLFYWRNKSGSEVDLVEKTEQGLNCYEIKYNPNKKPRLPTSFQENYQPISFKTVSVETFWELLVDV